MTSCPCHRRGPGLFVVARSARLWNPPPPDAVRSVHPAKVATRRWWPTSFRHIVRRIRTASFSTRPFLQPRLVPRRPSADGECAKLMSEALGNRGHRVRAPRFWPPEAYHQDFAKKIRPATTPQVRLRSEPPLKPVLSCRNGSRAGPKPSPRTTPFPPPPVCVQHHGASPTRAGKVP